MQSYTNNLSTAKVLTFNYPSTEFLKTLFNMKIMNIPSIGYVQQKELATLLPFFHFQPCNMFIIMKIMNIPTMQLFKSISIKDRN